jgi:small subunit ribosomal protein S2
MGPDAVQKLNDGGIYHFWQIAAMSPADVTKTDHDLKLGGKIEREGWVAQARELADA